MPKIGPPPAILMISPEKSDFVQQFTWKSVKKAQKGIQRICPKKSKIIRQFKRRKKAVIAQNI